MNPPDINKANFTPLTGLKGIAKGRAASIIKERKKRKFSDIEDCYNRTKVPRIYLEPFFFR